MSSDTRLDFTMFRTIPEGPMKSIDEIRLALKRIRRDAGVTQAEMGAAADLSNKTISAFENGLTALPWERLVHMAERCGWALGAYLVPHPWLPVWEQAAKLFSESDDRQRARIVRFLLVIPALSAREQERLLRILEDTSDVEV